MRVQIIASATRDHHGEIINALHKVLSVVPGVQQTQLQLGRGTVLRRQGSEQELLLSAGTHFNVELNFPRNLTVYLTVIKKFFLFAFSDNR